MAGAGIGVDAGGLGFATSGGAAPVVAGEFKMGGLLAVVERGLL